MKVVVRSSQFASVIYIILSAFILILIFCIIYMYGRRCSSIIFGDPGIPKGVFFLYFFSNLLFFNSVLILFI
jgi:uncharacterized membrane protein YozB (DUF420 family)